EAKKRGGQGTRYLLDTVVLTEPRAVDLMALDDALAKLSALDEEQGRVVELRFFGGLTEEETAEVLSVSSRTIKRKWVAAKTCRARDLPKGCRRRAAGKDRAGRCRAPPGTLGFQCAAFCSPRPEVGGRWANRARRAASLSEVSRAGAAPVPFEPRSAGA